MKWLQRSPLVLLLWLQWNSMATSLDDSAVVKAENAADWQRRGGRLEIPMEAATKDTDNTTATDDDAVNPYQIPTGSTGTDDEDTAEPTETEAPTEPPKPKKKKLPGNATKTTATTGNATKTTAKTTTKTVKATNTTSKTPDMGNGTYAPVENITKLHTGNETDDDLYWNTNSSSSLLPPEEDQPENWPIVTMVVFLVIAALLFVMAGVKAYQRKRAGYTQVPQISLNV